MGEMNSENQIHKIKPHVILSQFLIFKLNYYSVTLRSAADHMKTYGSCPVQTKPSDRLYSGYTGPGILKIKLNIKAPKGAMLGIMGSAKFVVNTDARTKYSDHLDSDGKGTALVPINGVNKASLYFEVIRSTDWHFSQSIINNFLTNDLYQMVTFFECSKQITLAQKIITVNRGKSTRSNHFSFICPQINLIHSYRHPKLSKSFTECSRLLIYSQKSY